MAFTCIICFLTFIFTPIKSHLIFISFRGEQLRHSFVSHLVDALERNEINFFIDKHELRGKDLKNLFVRIQETNVALVIFSTRWGMDELVKMKKLADEGMLQIIPIFYKVDSRDISGQKGTFGDNFWTLAKASTGDQIKNWKEALESISNKTIVLKLILSRKLLRSFREL